jgi:hypothetical protein
MKKIKVIDLYGVKYELMEEKVNEILLALQQEGAKIIDLKVIGEKLSQTSVFVFYEE